MLFFYKSDQKYWFYEEQLSIFGKCLSISVEVRKWSHFLIGIAQWAVENWIIENKKE